jgi:hypothetical protein
MLRRLLVALAAGVAMLGAAAVAPVAITLAGSAGAPAAPISNLSVKDTAHAARWSVQANLQRGNRIYSDSTTITFRTLPAVLAGAAWIQDVRASRTFRGSPLATFDLGGAADVYVGLDRRTGRPAWVDSTWMATGMTETGSQGVTYRLFRKSFTGGTVALGPIGAHHGAQAMYTVAAVSTVAPSPPPPTPTPSGTPSPGGGTSYEAEAPGNTLFGAAARRACAFCSGGGEVGNILGHGSPDALQFNGIMAPADGVYSVTWWYIAGDPNGDTTCGGMPNHPPQGCRPGDIVINGVTPGTIYQFPDTPNWHTLGSLTLQLHLKAGANTIKISSATADVADIDRIVVQT